MKKDYYELLGIEKNATTTDIKKAFHKLARKYHPDNNAGGDESKFKEINEAYQTLSNNQKRAEYDTYGQGFGSGASRGNPFGSQGFTAQDFDLGDIFGEFFSGQGRRAQTRRGRDISVDIQLTFSESVFGIERNLLLVKAVVCDICKGTGGDTKEGTVDCQTCNGQGRVRETHNSILGTMTSVRECSICHGRGKTHKKKCDTCNGIGVLKRQEEINIVVPAGIRDGEMIRLTGMGEAIPHGISGDLYVKVHVERHPIFRREGDNIIMDLDVKLTDALLGGEYTIETIEGSSLKLKIPAGVLFGEVLRVRGKGVPKEHNKKRRGDFLIKIRIKLPKKLSRKARKLFSELQDEGI